MNSKAFFEIAKSEGIEQSQISIVKLRRFGFSIFHTEIDSYTISETQSVSAIGVYNGKLGSCRAESDTKEAFRFLAKGIKETSAVIEKEEEASIFEGSPKYHKKNVYDPSVLSVSAEDKIALAKRLEAKLLAADERISEVADVRYQEIDISKEFSNSFGLRLKEKGCYFFLFAEIVAKNGDETKTSYGVEIGSDLAKFDEDLFVKKVVERATDKFSGEPCESGKYPTVLDRTVFADLLAFFLEACSAEEIQRHSSFLVDKLGERVASSKLTVYEKPLEKNIFFTYFDDEGVATQNKTVLKHGVLQTYFHNRETAKKAGVEPTGNGAWTGSRFDVSFANVVVKPGKKSFDDMILPIKDGVYITELAGLGTGMNIRSGDFSCQAEGFRIRDGKVAEPLNLITLSGNLLKMFRSIKEVDDRNKLMSSSINCPDVYVSSMNIGGK